MLSDLNTVVISMKPNCRGLVKVQFMLDGSAAHVKKKKLVKLWSKNDSITTQACDVISSNFDSAGSTARIAELNTDVRVDCGEGPVECGGSATEKKPITVASATATSTPVGKTALAAATTIVVVEKTAHFRRLARLEVRAGDCVCELGCSYGVATAVLHASLSNGPTEVVENG